MTIVKKYDILAATSHMGIIRIYLLGGDGQKKNVGDDDSFFVDTPFTKAAAEGVCNVIAQAIGLNVVELDEGMGNREGPCYRFRIE